MWSVAPLAWFRPSYGVDEGGRRIGQIELCTWRKGGEILFGARRLAIRREGFWSPEYRLQEGERTLASARSASAWRGGFRLVHEGAEYLVGRSSFLGRSFALTRGGKLLGEVRAAGWCSRRAEADVGSAVPSELGLFVVWLVLLAWRRSAAAGSASTAGVMAASS